MSVVSQGAQSTDQVVFLLGLSGAGKTFVGSHMAHQGHWCFLDFDMWGADGVDHHKLRAEWDCFLKEHKSTPLADALRARAHAEGRRGTVVGMPSRVVLRAETIVDIQADIRARYLIGSVEHCLASFQARERITGRGLPREWWIKNNLWLQVESGISLLAYLGTDAMRPFVVQAFETDGSHRQVEQIVADLLA